jgi:predicted alpha/beta-fold hydrolase
MRRLYDKLAREGEIWNRDVVPSLFVGTRGVVSSIAAYVLNGDGADSARTAAQSTRVREIMTMGADGARLVLDWEVPANDVPVAGVSNGDAKQNQVPAADLTVPGTVGNISRPIVLLVHGMNNDSSFGYIRSMMKTATNRGWVAVCMNLRGQDYLGQVKNTTPRGVS